MVATAAVLMERGNSGGPLLDGAGNLLGVVTLKVGCFASNGGSDEAPQNINFAVKSATSPSSSTPTGWPTRPVRRASRWNPLTSPIRRGR